MTQLHFIILAVLAAVIIVLQVVALLRARSNGDDITPQLTQLQNEIKAHQQQGAERIERELREQVQSTAQSTRQELGNNFTQFQHCLLYTSPSPRDRQKSRMPSSA